MPPITPVGIWIPALSVMVPLAIWIVWVSNQMRAIGKQQQNCMDCHSEMLKMHKDPDHYGFGTIKLSAVHERDQRRLEQLITDNTRAMEEVAHYIRWSIEHSTGTKPPPPTPAIMNVGD